VKYQPLRILAIFKHERNVELVAPAPVLDTFYMLATRGQLCTACYTDCRCMASV